MQGQAGCVEDDAHVEDDADAVRDGGQETNSARLIPEFKILKRKFLKLNQIKFYFTCDPLAIRNIFICGFKYSQT